MAKKALGRGLKALIPDTPRARAGFAEIAIRHLHPNPKQPRSHFDEEALDNLAASIREHGVLQPLLVSEDGEGGYLILAGERRWRAARRAGLERLPAVIREQVDDARELEIALVENLQRRDLTPLEEARAFQQLRMTQGLSQSEIASRVGLERSTITNSLRLLKLSEKIQDLIESGELSAGHARTLIGLDEDEQWALAEQIIDGGLSVRASERLRAEGRESPKKKKKSSKVRDPNLVDAGEKLSERLGVPVEIRASAAGGRIILKCPGREELMRVYEILMGEQR